MATSKLLEGILATNFFNIQPSDEKSELSGIEQGLDDLKNRKIKSCEK